MKAVVVSTDGEVVDATPLKRVGVQLACEGMVHGEICMVRWIEDARAVGRRWAVRARGGAG